MLLESKTVHIPHVREREADINEFGCFSIQTCAAFGAAAVEAGNPDNGQNDRVTDAADAIADILHYVGAADAEATLERARLHFYAESAGEAPRRGKDRQHG